MFVFSFQKLFVSDGYLIFDVLFLHLSCFVIEICCLVECYATIREKFRSTWVKFSCSCLSFFLSFFFATKMSKKLFQMSEFKNKNNNPTKLYYSLNYCYSLISIVCAFFFISALMFAVGRLDRRNYGHHRPYSVHGPILAPLNVQHN